MRVMTAHVSYTWFMRGVVLRLRVTLCFHIRAVAAQRNSDPAQVPLRGTPCWAMNPREIR